jgi:hypothetical protein
LKDLKNKKLERLEIKDLKNKKLERLEKIKHF